MISKRPFFPIAALSLSCVLVVILFIFPNSNFLGVVGFFGVVGFLVVVVVFVVVVTCVVVFIVGFVAGSEGSVVICVVFFIVGFVAGSEDSVEGLIVIVEVSS